MKSSRAYKTHHYLRRHLNAPTHSLRNDGDSSPDLLTVSTTQKQAAYGCLWSVGGGGFVADDYANGLQINITEYRVVVVVAG